MAVEKEDFEIVQYVARACNGEIIGRMDRLGMHSLHWAAETSKKDLRVLQFLLDQTRRHQPNYQCARERRFLVHIRLLHT